MNDFPDLLVRASVVMRTLLDVAMLLQVEPKQVFQWMAGIERPSDERIDELTERLQTVVRSSNVRPMSASASSRPGRRWCDIAAAPG
jgi:hypothetical protein